MTFKTVCYTVWPALSALLAYAFEGSLLCIIFAIAACLSSTYFRFFDMDIKRTEVEAIFHFWFVMLIGLGYYMGFMNLVGFHVPFLSSLPWAFLACFIAIFPIGIIRKIHFRLSLPKGEHVATNAQGLVDHDPDLEVLRARLNEKKIDCSTLDIMYVPEGRGRIVVLQTPRRNSIFG